MAISIARMKIHISKRKLPRSRNFLTIITLRCRLDGPYRQGISYLQSGDAIGRAGFEVSLCKSKPSDKSWRLSNPIPGANSLPHKRNQCAARARIICEEGGTALRPANQEVPPRLTFRGPPFRLIGY